jgi:hypothetical protein
MVSDVTEVAAPEICVLVIHGLPVELLEAELPKLPFLRERCPHRSTAVSCFPSTTGPAYFPLLAGVTPGRANVTGIRWFDRTRSTPSRFPHRGLRSYVGPDARRMVSDTKVPTMLGEHAWPASTPVAKDSPKKTGEKSRDALGPRAARSTRMRSPPRALRVRRSASAGTAPGSRAPAPAAGRDSRR